MKKLVISLALLLAVLAVNAQADPTIAKTSKQAKKEMKKARREQKVSLRELSGTEVSEQSKLQFINDFGEKPDVEWSHEVYFDRATFNNSKGTKSSAYYDYDGQLVGVSSPASFNDLPVSAQNDIKKHYTGYQNAPVIFYDDNETNETDMVLYGVQFEHADNYFIELKDKKNRQVVLQVTPEGQVSYFADVKPQ